MRLRARIAGRLGRIGMGRPGRLSDSDAPAPFVVGVNRSGTTLLRLMLDAHPQLAIPPETHFVPRLLKALDRTEPRERAARALQLITEHPRWSEFELNPKGLRARLEQADPREPGNIVRAFYRAYADSQGASRWGDKTPKYVTKMPRIHRALPEARFVHLIRDGRDVALSLLGVRWGPGSVTEAAEKWAQEVGKARRQGRRVPAYVELRYEDLISEPEPALRRICEFIELDFDPVMLRYHQQAEQRMSEIGREFQPRRGGGAVSGDERLRQHALLSDAPRPERAGRWRREMPPADVRAFEAVAGELLAELGYELGAGA